MSGTTPLYDRAGSDYDVTRCAEPGIVHHIVDLLGPHEEGRYLDLACGTGNYTVAVAANGGDWTAVDGSLDMLKEARRKSDKVNWINSGAQKLPFEDEHFDGLICTLALHHFQQVGEVGKEIGRVLKTGAPVVIFTSTPEQMGNYWLNHYFPMMMADSIVRMPGLAYVASALNKGGISIKIRRAYEIQADHKDGFLYCGKHNPGCYFDSRVREGISSFRQLIENYELEDGLERLKADMESGAIANIREQYTRPGGDYLFVKAVKTGIVLEEPTPIEDDGL